MALFPNSDIISLTAETPRYDLGESVGPDLALTELLTADDSAWLNDIVLGYGTAAGEQDLRTEIARTHGVTAEDVVLTVGGMHALFVCAFTLCEPGDEAITTAPLFPLAKNVLTTVGATLHTVTLTFEDSYQLDPEAIRQRLSNKTKLVVLATPQNPSGVAISAGVLQTVLEHMQAICPDAYLLLDETYREAVYGDNPVAPSGISLGTNVISCASLSKCHGAPGLRLGWAITQDRELREKLITAKFNTVISCSPVDEAIALKVLQQRERILNERRQCLAIGVAKVATWVQENSAYVDWITPDAGALCCVRLKPTIFDDVAIERCYAALKDAGVRVANGHWFDDDARIFRLGFGFLTATELDAALAIASRVLQQTARAAA